mmetsp:Transcript_34466/g.51433  ORF Transcript_34466/g.51433 Transcript_34466/m.51433 type:complete len:106 (+) Transcript_34466:669-986(+)
MLPQAEVLSRMRLNSKFNALKRKTSKTYMNVYARNVPLKMSIFYYLQFGMITHVCRRRKNRTGKGRAAWGWWNCVYYTMGSTISVCFIQFFFEFLGRTRKEKKTH